jgi:hypothetical protein
MDSLISVIEFWTEYEWVTVLHHMRSHAVLEWEARGVWKGRGWHGCGEED